MPEGTTDLCGYEVVVCSNCGFLFADKTATQEASDTHYAGQTKSVQELSIDREPESDIVRLNHTFDILQRRLILKNGRILDIGCGTGYLLGLLKKAGMTDLLGIDQSRAAAEIGSHCYKIKIDVMNVFDLPGDSFDFILLCHVLEHIVDISDFMALAHKLLSNSGIIYIEVPDALQFERYIDPRHLDSTIYVPDICTHFTPEHINYFTPGSLRNLMTRFGFEELFCESDPLGVVISAWKMRPPVLDSEGESCMLRYISGSNSLLNIARERIKLLAEEGVAVLVWGVGLHTQRLLATGDFAALKIIAFIDSDLTYIDKRIAGINIINSNEISNILEQPPILISSFKAQSAIVNVIEKLKLPNKIITLY